MKSLVLEQIMKQVKKLEDVKEVYALSQGAS